VSVIKVNLIPAHRQLAQQRHARQRFWLYALTLYSGLIICVCGAVRVALHPSAAESAAAEALVQTSSRIDELNTRLADTRRLLFEHESTRRANEAIIDQPDWSILLAILAETNGDNVVLREIVLKPDTSTPAAQRQYAMELRGYAITQPEVSQYVLRLQQAGLFDEVKLARTGREPVFNVSAVSFEISCLIRSDSAPAKVATGGQQ
jgi:Tfp pilus assembly protein PilN